MTEGLQEYFAETDGDKRKEILDAIEKEQGQTESLTFCRSLWKLRYEDPKSGRRVDLFLWELVELLLLYSTAKMMKKSAAKDTKKALEALGFSLLEEYGEEGREILYEELCNAVRLYLHTCDSKSYRKRLFGLSELKEQDWQDKVARDMWRLSRGLPERLHMEQEFTLLSKAVRDTYCRQFADGERLLRQREEECSSGKNKKQ